MQGGQAAPSRRRSSVVVRRTSVVSPPVGHRGSLLSLMDGRYMVEEDKKLTAPRADFRLLRAELEGARLAAKRIQGWVRASATASTVPHQLCTRTASSHSCVLLWVQAVVACNQALPPARTVSQTVTERFLNRNNRAACSTYTAVVRDLSLCPLRKLRK
jgi:hypothetical protein